MVVDFAVLMTNSRSSGDWKNPSHILWPWPGGMIM